MDTLSHGLWGSGLFGRKNRQYFLWGFFFGIAPDIFSFGLFTISSLLGVSARPDWSAGPPPENMIPSYVHTMYDITHSFVIFGIVFLVVWYIRKKPFVPLWAWAFHILVDIPTHSVAFFPTPFLWPFFNAVRVDGIPWTHPFIFIPNVILLILLYTWLFYRKRYGR